MKTTVVRYKIKADRVGENETYIKRVFEELNRERPSGLHYASFKLPDGVSFMHIVATDGSGEGLVAMPAFREFVARIKDRCDDPPVATELSEIGSFNFFAQKQGISNA
jgi:hypothetical protein